MMAVVCTQTDLFGESTRRAAAEVRLQTLEKEIQQLTATLSQVSAACIFYFSNYRKLTLSWLGQAREAERQLNGQLSQEQVSKSQLQIAAKETRDQLADARLTIEVC
jgi:NADPH-dependent ferric siderophore reductase